MYCKGRGILLEENYLLLDQFILKGLWGKLVQEILESTFRLVQSEVFNCCREHIYYVLLLHISKVCLNVAKVHVYNFNKSGEIKSNWMWNQQILVVVCVTNWPACCCQMVPRPVRPNHVGGEAADGRASGKLPDPRERQKTRLLRPVLPRQDRCQPLQVSSYSNAKYRIHFVVSANV